MSNYIKTLKLPILVVILNFFILSVIIPDLTKGFVGDVIFNTIWIISVFWAGWLTAKHYGGRLWLSSWSGIFMFFVAHVLLKGGLFLIEPIYSNYLFQDNLSAVLGVLISFVLLSPIAMLISVSGALSFRKVTSKKESRGQST